MASVAGPLLLTQSHALMKIQYLAEEMEEFFTDFDLSFHFHFHYSVSDLVNVSLLHLKWQIPESSKWQIIESFHVKLHFPA